MFSPFHAKNCQNIDHKEDTKEWEVFLNTEVEEVQSTLTVISPMLVSPLVRYHFFSKTGHEIILIFCMKLDIDNRKKLTKPLSVVH